MKHPFILQFLALCALFGWCQLPEPYLGWLLLPLWVLSGWLIFASSLETARLKRGTWLDQYLLVDSAWRLRLRGGWVMGIWHLLPAAVLALFMLVKLLWLSPLLWSVLFLHLPLLWFLGFAVRSGLRKHVKPQLLGALSRRLLVPFAGVLLLGAYLLVSLNLSQPNMQGMPWVEAIGTHLPESRSSLPLLAVSERAHQLLEVSMQWALQNSLGSADSSGLLGVLAWALLLASGSAFIWAWMRLLTGIAALCGRLGSVDMQSLHTPDNAPREPR